MTEAATNLPPTEELPHEPETAPQLPVEPEPEPPRVIRIPQAESGPAPAGFPLPSDLLYPRGKQVYFIRFRSRWTDAPWIGHPIGEETDPKLTDDDGKPRLAMFRTCVLWAINSPEKRLAITRARGDGNRATDELAKQMIRVIDGKKVDWVDSSELDSWWNQIGERCRNQLTRLFHNLHVMDEEDTVDFLENCIAIRRT